MSEELFGLKPYFEDLESTNICKKTQIDTMYKLFSSHFIDTPLIIEGKTIKIITSKTRVKEYSDYCETFYHVITENTSHGRIINNQRLNRVHWIKTIIENQHLRAISVFKWKDHNGIHKLHLWFKRKSFVVVLKDVSNDVMVVTAFCVSSENEIKFKERLENYQKSI
ncbi:hypothetical protein DNU06_02545 [Putridiphycobacter roseus]|uniref:Phage-Barnase-EndoU-ColicinE5/D-RelE like nuclease 2 domain-containing protein n=1 Tax=Putridiphycobacter roseus TaxID=2219161 RepID=A0A2W1NLK8_9FLAO|nr:hypothetical protein [Putridiphycobacter roseus]PZE18726.1 hypothetical protein DNU06_02545 [Putridiphycobacter roseus]